MNKAEKINAWSKYHRFKSSGCKDIRIRIFECEVSIQFPIRALLSRIRDTQLDKELYSRQPNYKDKKGIHYQEITSVQFL